MRYRETLVFATRGFKEGEEGRSDIGRRTARPTA